MKKINLKNILKKTFKKKSSNKKKIKTAKKIKVSKVTKKNKKIKKTIKSYLDNKAIGYFKKVKLTLKK